MKVGDLVRDKHVKSMGLGCLIKEPYINPLSRNWVCEVYWPVTKDVTVRRTSWLEVVCESR